jgi:hypothetical protein
MNPFSGHANEEISQTAKRLSELICLSLVDRIGAQFALMSSASICGVDHQSMFEPVQDGGFLVCRYRLSPLLIEVRYFLECDEDHAHNFALGLDV